MSQILELYEKIKHAIVWRITAQSASLLAYIQRCRFDWFIRPKAIPIESLDGSALVFAPHQDDETLGCGATLFQLAKEKGNQIHVAPLCYGITPRTDEHLLNPRSLQEESDEREEDFGRAMSVLGVKEVHRITRYEPGKLDLISTPGKGTRIIINLPVKME